MGISGGIMVIGGVLMAAGKTYRDASWRIPMGEKRYASLKALPVVSPKFNGIAISVRF
jgi:hypothetical protein